MSADRTGSITPDERREMEALGKLIDNSPTAHNCENCGGGGTGPLTGLPDGWLYLARGDGWESVDEVDGDTKLICSFCVTAVEKALAMRRRETV